MQYRFTSPYHPIFSHQITYVEIEVTILVSTIKYGSIYIGGCYSYYVFDLEFLSIVFDLRSFLFRILHDLLVIYLCHELDVLQFNLG